MHALLFGLVSASLVLDRGSRRTSRGLAPKTTLEGPAKCMDGNPAIYYADITGSDDWLILLMGGGECRSHEHCQSRVKTRLGSAREYPEEIDFGSDTALVGRMRVPNLVSSSAEVNPQFHGFNRVFVPYCSGDIWVGTQTAPTSGLTFAGAHIVEAVRSMVKAANPARVMLTGNSAGATGVIYHANAWADFFEPLGVAVKVVPRGGINLPNVDYTGPDAVPREKTVDQLLELYDATWARPSDCLAEHDAEYCSYSASVIPYVHAPLFFLQFLADTVLTRVPFGTLPKQDSTPAQATFLNDWAGNVSDLFASSLKPEDGLFAPACFRHEEFYPEAPLIDGQSFDSALAAWFDGDQPSTRLGDTCAPIYPDCNPTCPAKDVQPADFQVGPLAALIKCSPFQHTSECDY